jgi:RimJ/RimL family protein N-acetyltransferase
VESGGQQGEDSRLAGDVNIFLHDRDDPTNAEIEVMVAEAGMRRNGVARHALLMIMLYGVTSLGITRFFAKIGTDNAASLALFRGLGYEEVNYVEAFKEHELEVRVSPEWIGQLRTRISYQSIEYSELSFAPIEANDPED